ncbi:MAG TPA: FtsX-like permease family protein [Vicinamibacterales bacterium]|nr:FtsX-like permease family protein [Vicinamibacterales bacterium]
MAKLDRVDPGFSTRGVLLVRVTLAPAAQASPLENVNRRAIGVYGVVRYSVEQRTQEIGVRIALGARPRDVLALVLGQGLMAPFAGLAIGLLAALGLTRVLVHALFETSPTDPVTLGAVVLSLLTAALLACVLPARRAARIDPVVALRQE